MGYKSTIYETLIGGISEVEISITGTLSGISLYRASIRYSITIQAIQRLGWCTEIITRCFYYKLKLFQADDSNGAAICVGVHQRVVFS